MLEHYKDHKYFFLLCNRKPVVKKHTAFLDVCYHTQMLKTKSAFFPLPLKKTKPKPNQTPKPNILALQTQLTISPSRVFMEGVSSVSN